MTTSFQLSRPCTYCLLVVVVLLFATPVLGQSSGSIRVSESDNSFPNPEALIEIQDAQGRIVTGLASDRFTILQDGRPVLPDQVQITEQSSDPRGPTFAVVLDASTLLGSDQVEAARTATVQLLQTSPISTTNDPEVLTLFVPSSDPGKPSHIPDFANFTYDRNAVINYLNQRLELQSGTTRLYAVVRDAVSIVAQKKQERGTPGYVVLFSDGQDGLSADAFNDVLDLARQHQIKILAVEFGKPSKSQTGTLRLRQLANDTQGIFLDHPTPEAVGQAYLQLAQATARSTYRVRFTSSLPADGEPHSWQVLATINEQEIASQQIPFQALLPNIEVLPLSTVMRNYVIGAVLVALVISGLLTLAIGLWQSLNREDSRRLRRGLGDAPTFKRPNAKL